MDPQVIYHLVGQQVMSASIGVGCSGLEAPPISQDRPCLSGSSNLAETESLGWGLREGEGFRWCFLGWSLPIDSICLII